MAAWRLTSWLASAVLALSKATVSLDLHTFKMLSKPLEEIGHLLLLQAMAEDRALSKDHFQDYFKSLKLKIAAKADARPASKVQRVQ